jgi:polysaccharide export outer membrane protein
MHTPDDLTGLRPVGNRHSANNTFRLLTILLLAGTASACTTAGKMAMAPHDPEPGTGYATTLPPYRLNIGDVVGVRLLLNPELNEDVTVRPDGRISTIVASEIPAYSHTVPDLTQSLRAAYSAQLSNPHLTVEVRNFAPNRVYVAGEVTTPGEFITVGPNLTLVQAIARAGGVRLSASRDSIFIIRRGPNDVPQIFRTQYLDAISGRDPAADIRLAPYDIVYAPRTGVAEVYSYFNQYVQQFVPLNWGFNYNVNPIATTQAPAP